MIVSRVNNGYNERRNIAYACDFGIEGQILDDRIEFVKKAWHRLSGVGYSKLLHSFSMPKVSDAVLIHTFNAIVSNGCPWVVTFESTLPRSENVPKILIKYAWKQLAKEECQGIIALSECAAHRLREDLKVNRPRVSELVREAIRCKLSVLHPPQSLLIDSLTKKCEWLDWDGPLRLAIVGHDFYRKGGLELLIAIDQLLAEGKNLQLSIAGKMTAGDYASRAGDAEVRQAEEIIDRHCNHIHRLGSVPGERVHELLRESHILCLPTWGDTYGYSVLEGQASGCAAVTTNLRALPEINNADCGWMIEVPKMANGDGDLGSPEKRKQFRTILIEGLKQAMREAHDDRELLRRKANASLDRIREYHDPAMHAKHLKQIYQRLTR